MRIHKHNIYIYICRTEYKYIYVYTKLCATRAVHRVATVVEGSLKIRDSDCAAAAAAAKSFRLYGLALLPRSCIVIAVRLQGKREKK